MRYRIITYGCQANKSDSERIASFLEKQGYKEAKEEKAADLIVINACSVRKSATDRIHGKMRNIKAGKKKPVTVLTGCVLKKDKLKFQNLFDYVLQTTKLANWPLFETRTEEEYYKITPKRKGISAFIPIMAGCNNFCSYCVVPHTKGRETSRPAKEIIKEAKEAVSSGHKELWLLGQNVNSYGINRGNTRKLTRNNAEINFAKLLRMVNDIRGDFWIRFTSSHPKDFSDNLISAMKECKKVTKYLNLPLQSGDNEILQKMNRPYSAEDYKNLVKKIKKAVPDIALSTDIIVGFPGEEEKNFRNTVKLFRETRFHMAYISCYSLRPQTAAENLGDPVPYSEKKRRERILTELLKEISLEENQKYKGKEKKVLIIKKNKKGKLIGKTTENKSVLIKGPEGLIGKFVKAKITHIYPWGLKGTISRK